MSSSEFNVFTDEQKHKFCSLRQQAITTVTIYMSSCAEQPLAWNRRGRRAQEASCHTRHLWVDASCLSTRRSATQTAVCSAAPGTAEPALQPCRRQQLSGYSGHRLSAGHVIRSPASRQTAYWQLQRVVVVGGSSLLLSVS